MSILFTRHTCFHDDFSIVRLAPILTFHLSDLNQSCFFFTCLARLGPILIFLRAKLSYILIIILNKGPEYVANRPKKFCQPSLKSHGKSGSCNIQLAESDQKIQEHRQVFFLQNDRKKHKGIVQKYEGIGVDFLHFSRQT